MTHQIISAGQMLTPEGWRPDMAVEIGADGTIAAVRPAGELPAQREKITIGALLPAPGNVHSHSFQRAMAGLTESRGENPRDDFWTWRALMYRFLEQLTPDDIEAIAALVQMEMLEAGYAAIGEFHYLHHQVGGGHYDAIAELSERCIAAARLTGIGYTHLPVLYMRGGMDGRPLAGGQKRFGNDLASFARLHDACRDLMKSATADFVLGVAPHSLRAVDREGLALCEKIADADPIHIHAAEQQGEVEEALAALNARPVEWLLANAGIDDRWCFIHATQMSDEETTSLANARCVIGACPITESNLGDGILKADLYLAHGGRLAIGSDSDIRISLSEELRTLEYSQRLRDKRRVVLADAEHSCGRYMYERIARGSAQALGRNSGRIEAGALADFVAIDTDAPLLGGLTGDHLLDTWIFAGDDRLVTDVWAAGRHVVRGGAHINREPISARFNAVMARLRAAL
ncbi:MAG: formimidoylglutamate deiminase [Parvularculaceae bacterium]|nr:formimidoylglutamate deiminase [Parvularculaceae bacterium]